MSYLLLITSILVIGFSSIVSIPTSPYLLNGLTQKDISDLHITAITPASFTFSIWSVIYLSWIILALAMVGFPWLRDFIDKKKIDTRIIVMYTLAILITAVWLVPWAYRWIGTALIILFILLGTLWYLFSLTKEQEGLIRSSVELFMGWIHIATFANLIYWFHVQGWVGSGIESIYWGIGVLTIAFFATLFFQLRYRTYIVSMVYLWASLGIYFGQPFSMLTIALILYAIGIIGAMSYTRWKGR